MTRKAELIKRRPSVKYSNSERKTKRPGGHQELNLPGKAQND